MLTSLLAGLSILIVGDSHLTVPYYLIDSLHAGLEKQGAKVHTIGVCGTNPGDWLKPVAGTCGAARRDLDGAVEILDEDTKTVPIDQLISQYQPNLLIIVMGDTLGAYKEALFPKAWAWQQVTGLTKAIAKTETACVWIGPAWGSEGDKFKKTEARTKQVSGFLESNVAPCDYIDSLKLSKPGEWPTSDGQHFTRSGYQSWGDALTSAILQAPVVERLERK